MYDISFIAHQVNNPSFIKNLIFEPVGMEIDIAYSQTKKAWVVAHHDYDDSIHIILENWLVELKSNLDRADAKQLTVLWLDIKTPQADLSEICQLVQRYLSSELAIIYDIGRPVNILENSYHLVLKPYLRINDGIASWITKDELSLVDEVASKLDKASIVNTVISYGEIVEIDKETIEKLCQLNTTHRLFKKVFVWNIEYNEEIDTFIRLDNLNGQIVGNKVAEWDKDSHQKLDYFKSLCKKKKIGINKNFWL